MLAALLPLILGLAPQLATHLFGPSGGDVAAKVAGVVSAVTGSDLSAPGGSEAAILAIQGKAELATQLQIRLAEIAAAAHEEANRTAEVMRQAEVDELKAAVADTVSARQQTTDLAKAGSAIAWGAPVISALVLTSLGLMVWLVMFRPVPVGSENIAMGLVETLKLLSISVVAYWCGSSVGSRTKDATIASAQSALATSTPGGAPTRPFSQ